MSLDVELCDALLYRVEEGDTPHLTRLFNLFSRSLSYGMVMSSSISGLGTTTPVGWVIPGESLYFRGLRAYCAFDWEFQRQLLSGQAQPLPKEVIVLVGRFSREFIETFRDEKFEDVVKIQRAAGLLAPSLSDAQFRKLAKKDGRLAHTSGSLSFSQNVEFELWKGTAAKLAQIEKLACRADGNLDEKLRSMAGAYAPLCTTFTASFDEDEPEKSFTCLTMYMPPLHTLHAEDLDSPGSWYLERGFSSFSLPRAVQVSAARITHLSYLQHADRSKEQGMFVEVRRHFHSPQRVCMVVRFGSILNEGKDNLLGLDTSDHREALCLQLRAHLPSRDQDTVGSRTVKEAFNRALGGFDIEARIHKLTLHMEREGEGLHLSNAQLLQPEFSLADSEISFRIERYTESASERMSLKATGFTCEPVEGKTGYQCWREFWTWDRLKAFLSGQRSSESSKNLLVAGREKILGQIVGHATKTVLDQSMESIEEALDAEVSSLVSDYFERYVRAREILATRLHEGLF